MSLVRLQQLLTFCVADMDPVAALRSALDDPDLDGRERAWLAGVDPDGLRLTALLVQKLRFERILRGDPEVRRRFDEEPEATAEAIRRYLEETAPRAIFPAEEARAFRTFVADP